MKLMLLTLAILALGAQATFAKSIIFLEALSCEIETTPTDVLGNLEAQVFVGWDGSISKKSTIEEIRVIYWRSDMPELKLMSDLTIDKNNQVVGKMSIANSLADVKFELDIADLLKEKFDVTGEAKSSTKTIELSGSCQVTFPK